MLIVIFVVVPLVIAKVVVLAAALVSVNNPTIITAIDIPRKSPRNKDEAANGREKKKH